MIRLFHKHKGRVFGIVVGGFCALLMVPFGLNLIQPSTGERYAVSVGGEEVPIPEYNRRLYQWQQIFRQQFGENYEKIKGMLNIEQRALDELVNGVLLRNLASELGLSASVPQIEAKIAAHPFFQGKVTQASFEQFLRARGMNGQALQAATKQELIAEQLQDLFTAVNSPTKEELAAVYRNENTSASFRYLPFSALEFQEKVEVSEEEIAQYFEDYAEAYRKRKAVGFSYLAFPTENYLEEVTVTPEDIEDYYQENTAKFRLPSQVKLRHIFFGSNDTSELEALVGADVGEAPNSKALLDIAVGKAEEALARLDAGEDFSTVAAELSEDASSKDAGGDLGWIRYSALEANVRQSAQELSPGTYSQVIKTKTAAQIIFVEKKEENRVKPLEEVKAEIEEKLRKNDAPEYARAASEEMAEAWKDGTTLVEFAKTKDLTALTTEKPISRGEIVEGIPASLINKVVVLPEGSKEILEVDGTTYLVEVTEVKDSFIPELADVREQVVLALKAKKSGEVAKTTAEEALNKMRDSKTTLAQLATEYSLKIETTKPTMKSAASGPLFVSPESKQKLFALAKEAPLLGEVLSSGDTHYLVEIEDKTLPAEDELKKQVAQLREAERTKGATRLLNYIILTLKAQSDVKINASLLDTSTI